MLYIFLIFSEYFYYAFIINVKANTGITEISGTINYDYINDVLEITNEERSKNNLVPLILDQELTERANQRTFELVYSFSHTRPNQKDCFSIMDDLEDTAMGENIAAGYINPNEVMDGWMNSIHHRENIMGSTEASKLFITIGIGHANVNGRDYWVQLFGNKLNTELTRIGSIVDTKSIEVIIPEGKLDFSKSVVKSFGTTIKLNCQKTESYDLFYQNKPIISLKGFDVLLNWDDFQIISSDINIIKIVKNSDDEKLNSYIIKSIYGKSGSADIILRYNNVDYIYHINTIDFDLEQYNELVTDTRKVNNNSLVLFKNEYFIPSIYFLSIIFIAIKNRISKKRRNYIKI